MLLPDKLFSYNESTLSKFPTILKELEKRPMTVRELYQKTICDKGSKIGEIKTIARTKKQVKENEKEIARLSEELAELTNQRRSAAKDRVSDKSADGAPQRFHL